MKKIVMMLITFFIINTFCYAEFNDVTDIHWGYIAINNMAENAVLSGYPDGTFKPSNNITLAEYASIFSNFFDIKSNDIDNYFVNIEASHWAKGKIEAIREYIQPNYDNISEYLGINKYAFEDGILVNMPVTREIVIYSLNSILAFDKSQYVTGDEKMFADYEKILFPEAAVILYKNEIISGEMKDGKVYFAPDRYITRAEIASIFNKLLVDNKKLTNVDTIDNFNVILEDIIRLVKLYDLDAVKEKLYDSKNFLGNLEINSLLSKETKSIIDKYFNKLEYNIVDYGFYGYNKAYVTVNKKGYDYLEILKCFNNIGTYKIEDILKEIVKVSKKQKLKVIETVETINFIKNNNEWKIEL